MTRGFLLWLLIMAVETLHGILRVRDPGQLWAGISPLAGGTIVYSLTVMLLAPLIAAYLRPPHLTVAS